MKVLVVVDGHLARTPDGKVWSARIYDYSFFARYLSAFESVRIAMRIQDVENNEGFPNLCSGPDVEFFSIEEFRGPTEYLKKYFLIKKNMKKYFEGCDCAIFRIPSTIGYQFLNSYKHIGKPYAVEVVVDPWDFAAPGTLKTFLRPIIRYTWTKQLKKACLTANGASYVTKYALQKRYPSYAGKYGESKEKFEGYYSSVNISADYFAQPRIYQTREEVYKIIHVTNFIGNFVKGHKELIDALAILKTEGIILNVDFVGEGTLIEYFEKYAQDKGVGNQVKFIGKLSNGSLVRQKLIDSDLFVFPSHAEGLPRVLIEAMAVGLPCISTNVNGIPELLNEEYLVNVGEIEELAVKIKRLVSNPIMMTEASRNNILKASEYEEKKLQERRKEFYEKLRRIAEREKEYL